MLVFGGAYSVILLVSKHSRDRETRTCILPKNVELCGSHSNFSRDFEFFVGRIAVAVDPKSVASSLARRGEPTAEIFNGPVSMCKWTSYNYRLHDMPRNLATKCGLLK